MPFKFSIQRGLRLFAPSVLFCLALSFMPVLAEENIDAAPAIISEARSTRALTLVTKRGLDSNLRVFSAAEKHVLQYLSPTLIFCKAKARPLFALTRRMDDTLFFRSKSFRSPRPPRVPRFTL